MTIHYSNNINTKYYKYTYTSWTQPKLTSNNMSVAQGKIVCTASSNYGKNTDIYKIMLGSVSSTVDKDYWQVNGSTAAQWVQIKFPYKLKITGLSVYTRPADNYTRTVRAYTSSSKTTQIGSAISTKAANTKYTFLSNGSGIETDTIYLAIDAGTDANKWYGLQNLQITAQAKTKAVESTKDSYDYTVFNDGKIKTVYKDNAQIILGYKGSQLVYSVYPIGGTVFEKSTAGSYTFTPQATGTYEISLVGGGGGGACAGDQPSYASKSRAGGGGSGAYVCGVWKLTGGTSYSITVGAGGAAGPSNSNDSTGKAGGASSFASYITVGAGGGGDAHWKGAGTGGAAGTVSKCTGYTRLITNTAGNAGKGASGYNVAAGGAARLGSYGAGGSGQATGNYQGVTKAGNAGYCKIRFLVE